MGLSHSTEGRCPVESKQQLLRKAESSLLELYPPDPAATTTTVTTTVKVLSTKIPPTNPDVDHDYYSIHTLNITTNSSNKTATTTTTTTTSSPQQPSLVLLHGYMNGAAYFYRNFRGLSRSFSQLYALDLLGWGLSSRPTWRIHQAGNRPKNNDHPSLDDDDPIAASERFFVDSLEAWRVEHRIDKMILAGHSIGGYLSVAYAERYPQHVDKLVLLSPVGVPVESTETVQKRQSRRLTSWRFRLSYGFYEFVFGRWTPGDILRILPESIGRYRIQQYIERRLPSINQKQEQSLLAEYLYLNATLPGSGEYCLQHLLTPALFAKRPLVDRIPQLQIAECHFLYGEHDWMDAQGGLDVQERCRCANQTTKSPKVTVHQVRNAGHLLMLDNPEEFNNGVAKVAAHSPVLVGAIPKELLTVSSSSSSTDGIANE